MTFGTTSLNPMKEMQAAKQTSLVSTEGRTVDAFGTYLSFILMRLLTVAQSFIFSRFPEVSGDRCPVLLSEYTNINIILLKCAENW
jgi:hypothetical protein